MACKYCKYPFPEYITKQEEGVQFRFKVNSEKGLILLDCVDKNSMIQMYHTKVNNCPMSGE